MPFANAVSNLQLSRYAQTELSQLADQQPKVLNSLAVSRLATLNDAERALKSLGVEVIGRESNLLLDGRPQRLMIMQPNAVLLDLYSDAGKRLAWGMIDGKRVLKLHVFGVDVVWSQPV